MSKNNCGICGAAGISVDDFDNLFCGGCKATGTVGLDGAHYWEPDESWDDEGMEGEHRHGGKREGDEDQSDESGEYGEGEEEDEGEGEGEDEGEGDEDEDDNSENYQEGDGEGDFEIVFESRDYEHDGENQDGFPDPVSIVVDGIGKLLPAVRWLRDLTSMRDGRPIGLEEARDAITAVAKEDKRIEVKDVPSEASNIVMAAATFAGVAAREYTPPTPEEQEMLDKEKEKENA
jgi:hypothetical protein